MKNIILTLTNVVARKREKLRKNVAEPARGIRSGLESRRFLPELPAGIFTDLWKSFSLRACSARENRTDSRKRLGSATFPARIVAYSSRHFSPFPSPVFSFPLSSFFLFFLF